MPYYQNAIQQIESSRSLLESRDYRQSFFEGGLRAYLTIIETSLAANRPEDAFNYSERARSRVFLDVLGTKVQLGRQAQGADEEKQLQARIVALRGRATGANADEESENRDNLITPAQRNKELAAAEKAYADFLAKVRKENKEQASLMSVEPLTVKQVQDLLDPGVTMLEYFVTQDAVLLWVIEKDRTASVSVPLRRGRLRSRVGSFREAIQQFEEKDKFKQQSEELYKTLIEAALPHIKGKELIVVPHDVLHYLPFQALLSPQGKYLIEDFPISYLSSVGVHTGEALAGIVGSGERKKFGVTGDTVNTGSRVEGLNKEFNTEILITRETLQKVDGKFLVRDLGEVKVKGREKPVEVFEVLAAGADHNVAEEVS